MAIPQRICWSGCVKACESSGATLLLRMFTLPKVLLRHSWAKINKTVWAVPIMELTDIIRRLAVLVCVGTMLAACAETRLVMHTAKRLGDTTTSQGTYKVGKPYQVDGVWYYPSEDWTYDATGIASWYGPNFHGKRTANGEIFDQWAVTAAHKTLPMPSLVRVTNLENGRSLVVRINDRGPYKPGRIIDLSRRSAQLLGIEEKGTARVRVQILAKESQALAERAKAGGRQVAGTDAPIQGDSVASQPVVTESLPAPAALQTAPVSSAPVPQVAQVPVTATRMYVQAGAFSDINNAERVRARLSGIGPVTITPVEVNGRALYRVRLGPAKTVAEADRLLTDVLGAGYEGARTVVE